MNKEKLRKAVAHYIEMRDEVDEIKRRHKEELAPLTKKMSDYEEGFRKVMLHFGLDALPTDAGTAYTTTRTSVKIDDWTAALNYIRGSGQWHLLERRLNKTAVSEMAEEGALVPGTTLNSFLAVNVRRR